MSFLTNLRADRLITEIRSSTDPASPATQKAVARLKDVGPGAIEGILAALPDADKTATMAFVEVLASLVTPKTFPEGPGPDQFSIVHAIRVAHDGMVYVADREYRRVQMFTPDGKFLKQLARTQTTFARDLALSPDAEQQFLYVGGGNAIAIVDRKTLEVVGSVQPPGTLGPGHHIATDSKGNIYIAQTTQGLQKLVFKGMVPATQ